MDLLLPRTDAGVVAQLIVLGISSVGVIWALRREPAARLFAIGASVVLLALMGVRMLH